MIWRLSRAVCSSSSNLFQHISKSQIRNMGKVNVNGVGINYEKAGTGHHTVLCMPGAMGSALSDFGPQLRSLAGAELTLVAWDPPGYGASRPPARSFGSDFFRDDARAAADLMQELGHDKYSVLGWSDGGNSAVILAAERPENVTKLVIWGANAFVTDEDIRLYEAVRDIDQWSEKMRAPMLELYGEDYFRSTWNAWVDAISAFKEKENGICRREAAMVRCPTLVLHGAKDAMVPGLHPEFFSKHIPDVRLHVFPDGKHNLHLRYAEEFNRLVAEFLRAE